MLEPYIKAAMKRAKYEILPSDSSFSGEIAGFEGVYANAPTLEACQHELEEVLEGWISLRITLNFPLPDIEEAQAQNML